MSTLGKILVGVNLLFSVITGALIVMVFITRTQWSVGYKELEAQLKGERAAHVATIAGRDKVVGDKTKQMEQSELKLKETAKTLEDAQAALKAADAKVQAADELVKVSNSLVDKMKSERDNLTAELGNKDRLITEQLAQINKAELEKKAATEQMVKYKISDESSRARLGNLLEQYEKLLKEFEGLRSDKAARAGQSPVNPPPEDVKGTIQATDATSGLITVNLGSDNGLSKGNTLHVYRLTPRPTYVGLLRIMDVRPHEAVGKLTTSATRPGAVQVGDEVASKILDNR